MPARTRLLCILYDGMVVVAGTRDGLPLRHAAGPSAVARAAFGTWRDACACFCYYRCSSGIYLRLPSTACRRTLRPASCPAVSRGCRAACCCHYLQFCLPMPHLPHLTCWRPTILWNGVATSELTKGGGPKAAFFFCGRRRSARFIAVTATLSWCLSTSAVLAFGLPLFELLLCRWRWRTAGFDDWFAPRRDGWWLATGLF